MNAALTTDRINYVLAGVLILLFSANFVNDYRLGEAYDSLWICHMSLLLLSAGLILQNALFVQVSLLWIVPGDILWLLDSMSNNEFTLTSTLSHIGGLLIAVYAINRMRAVCCAWMYALGFFLCLQLLSRLTTPAIANVNISHTMWDGWQTIFGVYWQYWVFTTTSAIIGLWLQEKFLLHFFPQVASGTTNTVKGE
jgi:hypothetical protein